MHKIVKGALLFTGGLTVGAGLITGVFLKSKDVQALIKTRIINKLQS